MEAVRGWVWIFSGIAHSSWGDKTLKSPKGILNVDLSYLSQCTKKVFKKF